MAVPTLDTPLADYSLNMSNRITASPTTWFLTTQQASDYGSLQEIFSSRLNAVRTAKADGTRSMSLTASKDAAKADLLAMTRQFYSFVQANDSISDSDKILLGVPPKNSGRSPVPAPTERPVMDLVSVVGHQVTVRVHGTGVYKTRRPSGCVAAWIYSFVGDTYPSDPSKWAFCGSSSSGDFTADFPDAASGAQVFICAAWINPKQVSGPVSVPLSTHLQYGGVQSPAIKIAA